MYSNNFARLRRKLIPHLFLLKLAFGLIGIILLLFLLIKIILPRFTHKNYLLKLFQTIDVSNQKLRQTGGVVNVLVMGIGGGVHEGANLTDSIILASLNSKTKKISLISIPRDLWIEELQDKINSAYSKGVEKNKETGIILAKATVSEVLGIPVHYGIVVDFHAFSKIVDIVGGVDVDIENTFDDPEYPIEGKEKDMCGKTEDDLENIDISDNNIFEIFPCRFEKLHFDKGNMHMTGETALKYVRSRHAQGNEGTDFGRSKRQLKLISAIRAKITKPETYLNPSVFTKLISDLKNDIDTDLSADIIITLGRDYVYTDFSDLKNFTIDWGDEKKPGLLINPPAGDYNGAWVLIPTGGNGNWQQIHEKVKLFLEQ
jgi:LCP family protein required for cell wall assembly